MVGVEDHVQDVLDDQDAVPGVHEPVKNRQQFPKSVSKNPPPTVGADVSRLNPPDTRAWNVDV